MTPKCNLLMHVQLQDADSDKVMADFPCLWNNIDYADAVKIEAKCMEVLELTLQWGMERSQGLPKKPAQ